MKLSNLNATRKNKQTKKNEQDCKGKFILYFHTKTFPWYLKENNLKYAIFKLTLIISLMQTDLILLRLE